MKIIKFQESHIDRVVELLQEFEVYLASLSSGKRDDFDAEYQKNKLLKYGFGDEKSFSGYVAEIDSEIVGYVFYHYGFDPDEMQGRVIYLIDFFVSEKARRKGVGRALIDQLQSHEDSLGLYFGVWKKNTYAIQFYESLGANWCDDVPFMKLLK